ncbi:MAG: hypothetical protein WD595_02865 [Waddliaceae bacterium]
MMQSIEQKILSTEKKIKELEIECETLSRDQKLLFEGFDITEEQLSAYLKNPENFTFEEQALLQEEKEKLDAKLKRNLDSIKDPRKCDRERLEKMLLMGRR